MRCNKCGSTIRDDITLCPKCGNNIDEERIEEILDSNSISIPKIFMAVIIVLLIIISIYYIIVGLRNDLTVVGSWKCTDYTENINTKNSDIYYFKLDFNKDNSFRQYSIKNTKNTFDIFGTYSEELENKTTDDTYGYLDIYMATKSITRNGVTDTSEVTNHYEFGILKNKKSALVINTQSYSAYYCERD